MTTTPKIATISDRELVLTRIINAPREKIFKAWTDPKQLRSRCGSIGSAGRLRSGGAKQATETTPPEGNLDDEVVFFPSSQSPVPIEISVTAANGGSLVLNLEQICISWLTRLE